jgi:hypothetical protein
LIWGSELDDRDALGELWHGILDVGDYVGVNWCSVVVVGGAGVAEEEFGDRASGTIGFSALVEFLVGV